MSASLADVSKPPVVSAGSAPAPSQPRRRFRLLSIRFKFILFTVLLITVVMSAVGYSLYVQQSRALSREVLGRARTIAENLAVAAREIITSSENLDTLGLALLATGAVQRGETPLAARGSHDLRNPADLAQGLRQAAEELQAELPAAVERGLSKLLGRNLNWGFIGSRSVDAGMENEGVFEAIIVGAEGLSGYNGVIISHYRGTSGLVGKPYQSPPVVEPAGGELPYDIYEQEVFENGRRYVRKLYHVTQPVTVLKEGGQTATLAVVHLGVDRDLVDRVVFGVTMKLAVIALVAVLLGVLFTWVTVTWLTAPIGKLVKGVLAIGAGDFKTRIKVSSKDELGELTHAFNNMAVSLSQNETLKGAFSRYVSDAALKQILADPGKTGLHSRRVLATIYTSDVRGFTAMSESLEPEQVVQVINTYLSLQTEIILKHGGVVDKFIGDATIGVWGKEEPRPDDALNAVRAAFEVQRAIEKLNQARAERGEIVKQIGIGVNTGEVVSGNMGSSKRMEYTVTGEHVIYADQLCAECPGGKVWISDSTYQAVKDYVDVERVELKSKHGEGKPVWQVNAVR